MDRMKAKAKGIRRHVPAGVSRDDADDADEKIKDKGKILWIDYNIRPR